MAIALALVPACGGGTPAPGDAGADGALDAALNGSLVGALDLGTPDAGPTQASRTGLFALTATLDYTEPPAVSGPTVFPTEHDLFLTVTRPSVGTLRLGVSARGAAYAIDRVDDGHPFTLANSGPAPSYLAFVDPTAPCNAPSIEYSSFDLRFVDEDADGTADAIVGVAAGRVTFAITPGQYDQRAFTSVVRAVPSSAPPTFVLNEGPRTSTTGSVVSHPFHPLDVQSFVGDQPIGFVSGAIVDATDVRVRALASRPSSPPLYLDTVIPVDLPLAFGGTYTLVVDGATSAVGSAPTLPSFSTMAAPEPLVALDFDGTPLTQLLLEGAGIGQYLQAGDDILSLHAASRATVRIARPTSTTLVVTTRHVQQPYGADSGLGVGVFDANGYYGSVGILPSVATYPAAGAVSDPVVTRIPLAAGTPNEIFVGFTTGRSGARCWELLGEETHYVESIAFE